MAVSPILGWRLPNNTDAPDGATQMANLAADAEKYTNMRFASTAARDTAITTPVAGMAALVGGDEYRCIVAGAWALWSRVWTAYTPTITNIPTSAVTANYQISAGLVHVQIVATISGAATGNVTCTLPVARQGGFLGVINGTWAALDASAGWRYVGPIIAASSGGTSALLYTQAAPIAPVNATAPFVWAVGDSLFIDCIYAA